MISLVVPAAGLGSRLGFDGPKALAPLLGASLLSYVLRAAEPSVDDLVLIVRPGDEDRFAAEVAGIGWPRPHAVVTQERPTGSADAVSIGLEAVRGPSCLVLWADQVGVNPATIRAVTGGLRQRPKALLLPYVEVERPYVWLELDASGGVRRVGRQRDGDPSPAVGCADLGLFGLPAEETRAAITEEFSGSATGPRERDFVYVLPRLSKMCEVEAMPVDDPGEAVAVNTPDDLTRAIEILGSRA